MKMIPFINNTLNIFVGLVLFFNNLLKTLNNELTF